MTVAYMWDVGNAICKLKVRVLLMNQPRLSIYDGLQRKRAISAMYMYSLLYIVVHIEPFFYKHCKWNFAE